MFNEISIPRFAANGDLVQMISVPLSYAPKDKTIARLKADPNIDRPAAIQLPRISLQLFDVQYAADRHMNPAEAITVQNANNTYSRQYNPVPYDFNYTVWAFAESREDGNKIIEQILPFFTPEFSVRVELIPSTNVSMNIPIVLNRVEVTDNFADGTMEESRLITWTLDLTLKGYLYGPQHDIGLIKFVDVKFYLPDPFEDQANTPLSEELTVQPGLLANGSPTTNAAASIPYTDVNYDDDWDFAQTISSITSANHSF